ncbi:MAG: SIS domain-containing protein [Candidatus Eremiobacteraeota bacterium]|nr:SIS domain-containing protein [Candidatus Eremiobacteraeota bacterium]
MDRAVDLKSKRDFAELLADRTGIYDSPHYRAQTEAIVEVCVKALRAGKKILWMGNGGSAAQAQHMSAELSGRFLRERAGLNSEALSVNTSTITAVGNDYGYDHIFRRQIEAFAQPGDVVIGLTTSGGSKNIVLAFEEAKRRGATTIAITGNGGGRVAEIADLSFIGPTGYSAIVQEVHLTIGHIICDLIEQRLIFGE